jgi:manganese/iron transport system substrate-binding protein
MNQPNLGKRKMTILAWGLYLSFVILLAACSPANSNGPAVTGDNKLKVLATTTIVGDVVSQVGGENISLTTLLPPGSDPHSFQPTPQDAVKVAEAQLIFINGLGLEQFLNPLIENAGSTAPVVTVSDQIQAHPGIIEPGQSQPDTRQDPHVWMDPNNVMLWVDTIEKTLTAQDSTHAQAYQANAAVYRKQLQDLDAWIREQVAQIPEANRKLVTDHVIFGYFAARYGFEQVGAVIPGYSTDSQPSAQELASLEDAIKALGVKAIFVGDTVNPSLSEQVAQDTGTRLVFIHTGSLTGPDGNAPTYLDYIRYNVSAIVNALK